MFDSLTTSDWITLGAVLAACAAILIWDKIRNGKDD